VRLVLLAAAAVGTWLLLRRRRAEHRRVVVGWADGSELELRAGAPRERLLAIAEGVLR
jgi:hypothetical protein